MIKTITVTNYVGDSLELSMKEPMLAGFNVLSIDGLGPPKAQINTTDVLNLDGRIYNSARVDGRNIRLHLGLIADPTIEDSRLKLYRYFPIKKLVTLEIETDSRTARIQGYVESNEPDIFSPRQSTTISIICPDAYFYSSELVQTSFSGIETGFEFPFDNNSLTVPLLEFGQIQIATERSVIYNGDAEVGIVIKIHALGEATNILIHNVTTLGTMVIDTDRIFDLTGFTFGSGDDIIISTLKGNKYVTFYRNGVAYNILNALDRDTSWFELTLGDNLFVYTADSGVDNLQFEVEHRVLFEGV